MSELEKVSKQFILQDRSAYQIEHFVVGQHDTPEMQYRQIMMEAQDLIYKIRLTEIRMQKTQIEIGELSQKSDAISALEIQEKELELALSSRLLIGAKQELEILENLYKKFPQFTQGEIEENQPRYWELRLSRQARQESASAQTGISAGNLQSMLNAGLIEGKELES